MHTPKAKQNKLKIKSLVMINLIMPSSRKFVITRKMVSDKEISHTLIVKEGKGYNMNYFPKIVIAMPVTCIKNRRIYR